jgi:hypothetical protein
MTGDKMGDVVQKIKNQAEDISKRAGYLKTDSKIESIQKFKAETSAKQSNVDVGGTITLKVDAPSGINKNDLETYINSTEFKQKVYQLIKDVNTEKERSSRKTY